VLCCCCRLGFTREDALKRFIFVQEVSHGPRARGVFDRGGLPP
jgi:hypothetical protein